MKPEKISGFFAFYLYWSIPIGIISTVIALFTTFDPSEYVFAPFLAVYDIFAALIYITLCVYVMYAFIKCKSDAVIMAKYQLIMLFLSHLPAIIFSEITYVTIPGILWSIIFFVFITVSDDVKERIPLEMRKLTKFSKIFITLTLSIQVLSLVLGSVEAVNGRPLLASPQTKVKIYCEQVAMNLPVEGWNSCYVDGETVVCGYDINLAEMSELTKERKRIVLKELVTDDISVDDYLDLYDLCIDADYDLIFKYVDALNKQDLVVEFTPEELSEIIQPDYVHTVPVQVWDEIAALYNAELPALYLPNVNLDNIFVDSEHKKVQYNVRFVDVSVNDFVNITASYLKSYMYSTLDYLRDEVYNLAAVSGYDIEYVFTADCMSWWTASVVIENEDLL